MHPPSAFRAFALTVWLVAFATIARGQVVINEVSSASNERLLQWTAGGAPRLGSGIP